ncbi:Formamidopyrimidine-DNA glycosylase N-terminal domain-containing protein [Mariannaea sp. PMI_226]|nr:Formamidopyrimidine-DNA glycosylase N-terminal domain-containing protein [Mariannaea sp. PMI_226]
MPEIAEVARIVHFLRLHVVGKRIVSASAIDDNNVFGKVGTSGAEVEAALNGKKIVSSGSQGKYFWITLEKPPHLVMHFGMTGWVHIKNEKTAYTNYYKKMKDADIEQWPPKFWKFQFKTEGDPGVEVAFTDSRRFGRVRLVDCPGEEIRKHSPLVENGPDPVVDPEIFTEEYLRSKIRSRRVPIKALLLDQAVISGIGNWVADETLYQAKLHPEQYCDEFDDSQIAKLYENIRYVCQTSVDKLGDSDQFPEHWLFNYRWGKGTKGPVKLPNGEKLAFITVGGRTSCYAPGVQKKTGRVVPGIKEEPVESKDIAVEAPKKSRKNKSEFWDDNEAPAKKKRAAPTKSEPARKNTVKQETVLGDTKPDLGRRRSTRLKKSI